MDRMNDEELITLAAGGDGTAFESLLSRHYMHIFRIAYKWCGINEDAEDIAQEVCIKLAKHVTDYRFQSAFTSWLYRVTINTAKDYYKSRNRKRDKELAYGIHLKLESQFQSQSAGGDQNEIYKAIDQLPVKLKDAVLLVIGEGLNHKEAAKIMSCAETTISWRIFQAKKRLKKWCSNG